RDLVDHGTGRQGGHGQPVAQRGRLAAVAAKAENRVCAGPARAGPVFCEVQATPNLLWINAPALQTLPASAMDDLKQERTVRIRLLMIATVATLATGVMAAASQAQAAGAAAAS